MKLLLDMNMQERWVKYLSQFGMDSTHWSAVGRADAPDEDILQHARAHGLIILTQDLDFGIALALTRETSPSVIQLRSKDVRPEVIGGAVTLAVCNLQDELARGALLTIQPQRVRLTLLPLR